MHCILKEGRGGIQNNQPVWNNVFATCKCGDENIYVIANETNIRVHGVLDNIYLLNTSIQKADISGLLEYVHIKHKCHNLDHEGGQKKKEEP